MPRPAPLPPSPSPAPRPPPSGVPRWLWPPPGAEVRRVCLRERLEAGGALRYEVVEGEAPDLRHLRALTWLLDEHPRAERAGSGVRVDATVVLEIATTRLRHDRVGHAYALDGGPLGDPAADAARGVLWRWALHATSA